MLTEISDKFLIMKEKNFLLAVAILGITITLHAQDVKSSAVPVVVKSALHNKYPKATRVSWEKENGNYEANWGGKGGEDNSVQLTAAGEFIEIVNAIPVSKLPKNAISYIKSHYKGARISEAGKITDAKGKISYEAEVKRKDLVFDEQGNFIKVED
jgi:hypothetical protein